MHFDVGNGKRGRKWRKREEIEREWGNVESQSLSISSFSLHFLLISSFSLHFLAARLQGCNDSCSPGYDHYQTTWYVVFVEKTQEFLSQSTGPKPLFTPEHTHLPKAYKLVWQKKKITLWLLFQCASRNVRLTGRERTCGPSHSTAFLPRFGLTVDFIFWFMFALKVWIIKLALHPYLLLGIHRDHHL